MSKFFGFYDCEDAGNVEAEVEVALGPAICCLSYEGAFRHAGGIGEHELEYVAAGFYVYTDGEAAGSK